MSKAIYFLKVVQLKMQFMMLSHKLEALIAVGLFVSLVYIRGWSRIAIASKAAAVDLEFLSDMEAFARLGYSYGNAACKATSPQLWYITETHIAMAFFDAEVAHEDKAQMVASLANSASKN